MSCLARRAETSILAIKATYYSYLSKTLLLSRPEHVGGGVNNDLHKYECGSHILGIHLGKVSGLQGMIVDFLKWHTSQFRILCACAHTSLSC